MSHRIINALSNDQIRRTILNNKKTFLLIDLITKNLEKKR